MAKIFIPGAALYYSDLDGAWEFPETVRKERAVGELEEFLTLEKSIVLNNSETPQYLVRNLFDWNFRISETKPVWLEVIYQPWSSETERGFDDPYIVVYLNQALIFKEKIDGHCCQRQIKQWYLGELSGENTIYIYAGEMGDLEKPSGIELESLKLLTEKAEIEKASVVADISIQPSAKPIEPILSDNTPLPSGAVLGVKEELAEEAVKYIPSWRTNLENIVFHPWFFWLSWLGLFLLLVIITLAVRQSSYIKTRKEKI